MKLFLLVVISAAIILSLCSCGKNKDSEELAQEIRIDIIGSGTIDTKSTIRADYGQSVYDFSVSYVGNESEGLLTVLSPETVAGVEINISGGEVLADFDSVSLYMGTLDGLDISPACALCTFIQSWKSGYITASKEETLNDVKTVSLTICVDDTVETKTWFDAETLKPVYGELISEGQTVLFCSFSDTSYSTG